MINWYKPSEKMPEDYEHIVVLHRSYEMKMTAINTKKYEMWFMENIYRWAYAIDFNFPKEKE